MGASLKFLYSHTLDHYFHVVFTLPAELRGLVLANPKATYDLLFRCAAATLLELGRDPKRLGGELGLTAVLHTSAQNCAAAHGPCRRSRAGSPRAHSRNRPTSSG